MSPRMMVLTTLLPAALVIGVLAVGLMLARRGARAGAGGDSGVSGGNDVGRGERWPAWVGVLATLAAFLFGAPFILGKWPPLPPVLGEEWVVYVAIVAAAAAFLIAGVVAAAALKAMRASPGGPAADVGAGFRMPFAAFGIAAAVTLAIGIGLRFTALRSAFENQVGPGLAGIALMSAIALGMMAITVGLERAACRLRNAGLPFALGLIATLSVPGLFMSSSAKLAQLALVLAMGPGLASLAGLFFRGRVMRAGAFAGVATLFVSVHVTLWLVAHFYAEAPLATTILACVAPAAVLVGLVPPVRMKLAERPVLGAIVPGVLAALVMVAAVGIAARTYLGEKKDQDPGMDMYSLASVEQTGR